MDILELIDRLDDLFTNAKSVPLTGEVRLKRDEAYDILDQMRATIPEEILQARAILAAQDAAQNPPQMPPDGDPPVQFPSA